jgi:hypothetical protein
MSKQEDGLSAEEQARLDAEKAADKEAQKDPELKEARKQAKEAASALPEKRAYLQHTDAGYALQTVEGGDPLRPSATYLGLDGLVEKVEELEAEGYVVYYAGAGGKPDVLVRKPKAAKSKA